MSELRREYRVLCHDRRQGTRPFPEVKLVVREDSTTFADYDADRTMAPEDDDRYRRRLAGLKGVRGLVEATARECELEGHHPEVQVRVIGEWENVNREELTDE